MKRQETADLVKIHRNAAGAAGAQPDGISALWCVCGTPARMEILLALADASFDVGALAAAVSRDITNVSHQLKPLREARLVKAVRKGTHVVYSLDFHAVETEEDSRTISVTVRGSDGSSVRFTVPRGAADGEGGV